MTSFLINPYRFGAAAAYDTDAQAYITAVEAADGQALETGVRDAINAFVVGCKADAIWTAIKASCILAGARTLSGALVPLVGTAPTNSGLSGYNRKTGLIGTATSTNRLISNYTIPSGNQNNAHGAAWVSTQMTTFGSLLFGNADGSQFGMYPSNANTAFIASNSGNATDVISATGIGNATGFWGIARSTSSTVDYRIGTTSGSVTRTSATPRNAAVNFFAGDPTLGGNGYPSNARLAFYSIGESLTLSLLDSRVSTLLTAIAAAIP
jgi:hypothetical protein